MANQTCNPQLVTQALGIQATGPRTVIVPADPIIWDESTSYEYMTLVASTDFGQGYVSKRDVPSGTPLTDTDYWIPVASYNAQLAQLQNTVSIFEGRITDVENSVKTLETEKHMVVIGDSFSVAHSTASANPLWCDLVSKQKGLTLHNYAQGSAGYAVEGLLFSTQVSTAATELADIASDVSEVYVYGGWNDVYNQKNVYQPCLDLIAQIKAAFPNAIITIMGCNTFMNMCNNVAGQTTLYETTYILNTAAMQTGCRFIDMHTLGLGNQTFFMSGSNEHPNEAGEAMIAAMVMTPGLIYHSPSIVPNSSIEGATGNFDIHIDGNMLSANITNLTPTNASVSITLPLRMYSPIYTIPFMSSDKTEVIVFVRTIIDNNVVYVCNNADTGKVYNGSFEMVI